MLALRQQRLAEGARPLGWKVGFGTPAAMAKLGTERPLVGFLTDPSLLEDGATVSLAGWTAPFIEAEVAVHLGAGLSVAIELADTHPPPEDPDEILAGNIFHRHVLLGPVKHDASPIWGRLLCDGVEVARTDALLDVDAVLRDVEATLSEHGERLSAGEVIITGSIVAPLPCAPGQHWQVEIEPLGTLAVTLSIG